jgi:hypothetical protein
MAATLGGVTIPSSIVWSDRISAPPVSQTVKRTLGGKAVVTYAPQIKAQPITLSSLEDQGCVTLDIAEQLYALSEVPGGIYTLTIGSETFQVMFRHDDPPAFSAAPIIARSVPLAGDLFQVTVKLITV